MLKKVSFALLGLGLVAWFQWPKPEPPPTYHTPLFALELNDGTTFVMFDVDDHGR